VAVGGRAAEGAQGRRRLLRGGLRLRLSPAQAEKRSTWRILFVASRAATLYDSASVG
jgi:hypothetical protein